MRSLVVSILLASLCFAAQKKGKQTKPPEVAITEVNCHREGSDVIVDGRVTVTGDRPLKKLQLLIDFLGSDKQLLQTKRGEVDDGILKPGEEAEFHMRVSDPIRAVMYSLRAEEGDGRELRLDKAGPYAIE
ncbi:MAG: hypothetical protein HYZ37_17730 [Candidatus Solibacter usitatus]|nr:hypothetical protein [Candidatus Solibacter usitatus]